MEGGGVEAVLERDPAPELSLVLEECTLLHPLGGRDVPRRRLEHLLEVAGSRRVEIQAMPLDQTEHVGLSVVGVMKFEDGTAIRRASDVG
ncbi:Scr1 family TA system antitoxin-like transcriptional regulator [Streptomyces bikiniensis]|uniref:Scr1 family TA system antitoxin-like transcriptional regulator n=1 Tax=Streptomyces bikiniensis TaxID=1896 RepID=A0ABW8CQD6_STRBI